MTAKIRVDRVQFFDENPIKRGDTNEDAYPGCDGAVWYEIVFEPDHPMLHRWGYMMQIFARDGPKTRPGATPEEIAKNHANVWAWDGNRQAPTLSPSFLCEYPPAVQPLVRVHLFLQAGKISLCSDSTVEVA